MRTTRSAVATWAAMASTLFAAAPAVAAEFVWEGEIALELGTLPPVVQTGSGLATINTSAGGSHLATLRIGPGFQVQTTIPVTDPDVTAVGVIAVKATATPGAGTLAPFSNGGGALTQNTLPVPGTGRLCLFFAGCDSAFLELPLTESGTVGLGIGGALGVGGFGTIRVSLAFGPWTIGTRSIPGVTTDNGGTTTFTQMGFVHGPASATSSSAAQPSAEIQIVTPIQVDTVGIPGGNDRLAWFGVYRIHLIPEPGWLALLATGVVGLLLLGRRRLR